MSTQTLTQQTQQHISTVKQLFESGKMDGYYDDNGRYNTNKLIYSADCNTKELVDEGSELFELLFRVLDLH